MRDAEEDEGSDEESEDASDEQELGIDTSTCADIQQFYNEMKQIEAKDPTSFYLNYRSSKEDEKNKEELVSKGGDAQTPCLVDESTMTVVYESSDIVSYLMTNYGHENEPAVK